MDPVAISALILSVLSGLGHFIKDIDLYHIGCCCVNSDCHKNIVDNKINNLTEKISKHNITINIKSNIYPHKLFILVKEYNILKIMSGMASIQIN